MTKYDHAEAFKLMWYACECGHRERIWNSRDGVTAFGTMCPSCGGSSLLHVDWGKDELALEYQPHKGQRYWADGTPNDAIEIVKKRIRRYQDTGNPVPAAAQVELMGHARTQTGEWQAGWPMLKRQED